MQKLPNYYRLMRRNIRIAYVQTFFEYCNFFMPIWYAFETQFASAAVLSIIYAVAHLLTTALELPTGALADLIGRKKTITLGLVIQGLSWIFISQTQSSSWLWVGYLAAGIGSALISGSDTALYYDSLVELKEEKTFAQLNSRLVAVSQATMVIGSVIGGYIFVTNQRLPYILFGLSVLISAMIGLLYTEPDIDSEHFTLSNYIHQTKEGFSQLFKTKYSKQLSLYYVIGAVTWYFLYFLDLAYLTSVGFSSIFRGWIFGAISVLVPLITILLTHKNKLSRKYILIGFPLIIVLGFAPSYWLPKFGAVIAFSLVYFAAIARFTFLDQYVNEVFLSKYRATALSALNMSVSILFAAIAIIGSFAIDNVGPKGIMSVLGLFSLLTIVPVTVVLLKMMPRDDR